MSMCHSIWSRVKERRGFTLLLAALIASIVLSIGASIFTIASKQIILSATGRDSQFAFYAADSAAECALYWDIRYQYFATTSPAGVTPTCDLSGPVGSGTPQPINATGRNEGATSDYPQTMTFQSEFFKKSNGNGYCVYVCVTKLRSTDPDQTTACGKVSHPTLSGVKTVINANGYSVPCNQITTSETALQRSVELQY